MEASENKAPTMMPLRNRRSSSSSSNPAEGNDPVRARMKTVSSSASHYRKACKKAMVVASKLQTQATQLAESAKKDRMVIRELEEELRAKAVALADAARTPRRPRRSGTDDRSDETVNSRARRKNS